MTYKSNAIEALLESDTSGRLRALHDSLVGLGLKTKMVKNSDTLLFEAVTPLKARIGIAAIRGGNQEVLSFPRTYWGQHAVDLRASLQAVEPRHFIEPEGFVSSSQFSLLQVRVSSDTQNHLQATISNLICRHVDNLHGVP